MCMYGLVPEALRSLGVLKAAIVSSLGSTFQRPRSAFEGSLASMRERVASDGAEHGASAGAEAAAGLGELSFVRGFVAGEQGQIRFVEAGDLLEPDYLREVAEALVGIGERLEREAMAGKRVV